MAVAFDKDLKLVIDFFKTKGPAIFSARFLSGLRKGPKYSPEILRSALETVFGTSTLAESPKPVVIPATTLNRFGIRVFTNLSRKDNEPDQQLKVVDVIMATCAAPTFLPPVPAGGQRDYVDGGLWANTPSLLAVMQAHAHAGIELSDIRVVKVGNGKFPEGSIGDDFRQLRPYGPGTIRALFEMMFATQDSAGNDFLQKLIGDDHMFELDVQLREKLELDDARSAVRLLPGLAEEIARNQYGKLEAFLGLKSSYRVVDSYFDGRNRDIVHELTFGHGGDSEGTALATTPLASVTSDGSTLRVQRLEKDYRWLIGIRKYKNTASASTDSAIPADASIEVKGEYVRFIRVRFRAQVQRGAHTIAVRLRKPNGDWLKSGPQEQDQAVREMRISSAEWGMEESILGPIRADQPCKVTLEIGGGPIGDRNLLLIRDLEIHELRKQ